MLTDIKRNFQTAVDRQDQEGQMYDRGEINPLQYGLRTAGNAVDATLGNVVGTATDYLIPDEVEQYVGEVVMDTAPAQYAMELAQRYPEQARDLSAGLSIAEAVPFVRGIIALYEFFHSLQLPLSLNYSTLRVDSLSPSKNLAVSKLPLVYDPVGEGQLSPSLHLPASKLTLIPSPHFRIFW